MIIGRLSQRLLCALSTLFLVTFASQTQAFAALGPADFGRLPVISDLAISPDGKSIAMFQPREGRNVLVTYSLDGSSKPNMAEFGLFEGFGLRWVNNDYVLVTVVKSGKRIISGSHLKTRESRMITVHRTGKTKPQIMLEPKKGAGAQRSYSTAYAVNQGWYKHRLYKDDNGFLAGWYENGFLPLGLFRINVRTGKGRVIYKGNNETDTILLDMEGIIRFRADAYNTDMTYFHADDKTFWRKLENLESPFKASHPVAGFDPGGKTGYVYQRDSKTKNVVIYRYDFVSDKMGARVFGHEEVDVDGLYRNSANQEIIGVGYTVDQFKIHYLSESWRQRQALMEQTFPNMAPRIVSSSDDLSKHVIRVATPFVPSAYYLFDEVQRTAVSLGSAYPQLKSNDLSEVVPIEYAARDGLKIKGYLTLPNGKGRKNLPLVVLPHGGPQSRDALRFDFMAQFFAYKGYAVFQPNFRGSDGYGTDFSSAGRKEWGGKMSDDVTDGVRKLLDLGFADKSRICIVGGSYGGYAALIGTVLTPDLYRCAISLNGVSDLLDMLSEERRGNSGSSYGAFDYWTGHIGHRQKDRKKLIATSPARQADHINTPILLLHSTDDRSVPIEQSDKMAKALKDAGKPYKYVVMEGGDHFLLTEKTRLTAMREMDAFLSLYLK
jgi:dipeptidyl aminopeptidase/acylaminoacyl peptidase